MSPKILTLLLTLASTNLVAGPELALLDIPSVAAPVPAQSAPPAALTGGAALLPHLALAVADALKLEGELQLELARPWPAELERASAVELLAPPAAISPSLLLRIRWITPAGPVENTLPFRAQLWREAFYTREPLVVANTLDLTRLETRRVDLLRDREAVPADTALQTLAVARALPAGRLVTWRDVGRRPMVRRGQTIDVAAVDGMLSVTIKAVAMQDGAEGDSVRFRNPESKREFAALVTGEARAVVRF